MDSLILAKQLAFALLLSHHERAPYHNFTTLGTIIFKVNVIWATRPLDATPMTDDPARL